MLLVPSIPKINRWNKIDISIFPPTNSTQIVPFNGKLDSTLGQPKFTQFLRDITYLNTESLSIFVGIILGDANFNSNKSGKNVRISFKQSIINLPYMFEVFNKLSHYCSSLPRLEYTKLTNLKKESKLYGRLVFETRSYPVLNQLQELFVENGIKVIKPELFHYLTPVSLAHWIMSDGVSSQYGLTLCTDGFTFQDVSRLINILIIRYQLDCRMHFYSGKKVSRVFI